MTVITIEGSQRIKCDGCGCLYPATITNENNRAFVESLAQSEDYQQEDGVWELGFDDLCPDCLFSRDGERVSVAGCFDEEG